MWFSRSAVVALLVALGGFAAQAQTTVTFTGTSAVDLGSNLDKLADLDPWSYTLGTDWDENFTVGGIIGAPNTTVIPEVKILGEVIIPQVKADTRTGARMQGRVWGDVGLEFSADFVASGLEPGVGFNFAPTLTYNAPQAGAFMKLSTTTGLQNNPSFTEAALELPAVDAQIDFFFNLDMTSSIDYGLFPLVPYNSVPFNPGGIHLDQRNDPNKSLLRFQASLDPDDNGGDPLPPTFTAFEGVEVLGIPLEQQLGQLGSGEFLASHQFSTKIKDKNKPNAPQPRIDLGEIQVVNPFGTGGGLLGGGTGRNLEIGTTVTDGQIGYTTETALFRMGLDLDGIAAGLAFGQSFTRIEEDIKIGDTKIAEIVADIIDLKYGPEVGFRESVEINPQFNVTLDFLDANGVPIDVAINDHGSVSLMSTFQGNWGDLPDIALLDTQAVDVVVSFDELTGDQSKRGVFFLTDYLEFTLLELESLNILDAFDLSLPPVFRTRTSLLGNLLGEVELEAYTDSQAITPFDLGGALPTTSFTITPTPTMLAYLTTGGNFNPDFNSVRRLSNHSFASGGSLAGLTVVIGQGNTSSEFVGDFTPLSITDPGHIIEVEELMIEQGLAGEGVPVNQEVFSDPRQKTVVMGLEIIEGSTYTQAGSRTWETATLRNDGVYTSAGDMTRFSNPGGTMLISGSGLIEFEQRARLDAAVIIHGQGHTLRFDTATGFALQPGAFTTIIVDPDGSSPPGPLSIRLPDQIVDAPRFIDAGNIFINAGTLDLAGSTGEIFAGMKFDNAATGTLNLTGDGNASAVEAITLTTPDFTNNGVVTVGPGSRLDLRHPNANFAQDLRGDGTFRVDGGAARFLTNVTAYAPDAATVADAAAQTFEVINGGSLEFQGNTLFYAKPTFEVSTGSTLTFNGLGLDGTFGGTSKFAPGAPIDVVNDGHLIFNSGSNSFRLSQFVTFEESGDPVVIPIGLENNGTVTIRYDGSGFSGTRLTLDAEIQDYAEGGATFDAGTWKIIGPTPTGLYNNLTSNDSNVARFNLNIDRVQVGQNYLSVIDPGQPGAFPDGFVPGYTPTGHDTFMAVNKSDITLSGRAKFAYLNTIEKNAGSLTFDNKNHFTTAGDLTNTGVIDLTSGARLDVSGDLLVDGGTVLVDATSVLSVGANTIEVIGGNVLLDRPVGTANVNTPWIVRERTLVDNQGNVTQIIPGIVDYGGTVFPTLGPGADITVAGKTSEYRPLRGLQTVQGKLTLDAGNTLTLNQNLTNTGEVNVLGGANLLVNADFTQAGNLTVGTDSYVKVTGTFSTNNNSVIHLDGVLEAGQLNVTQSGALTGAGRISGGLYNNGDVNPGNSPGILQAFGAYEQDFFGTLTIDAFGPNPGTGHDQLLADSAILAGTLTINTGPDVITNAYGKRLDILLTTQGVAGTFDTILNQQIDADHQWVVFYEPDRVSLAAALIGDANLNGQIEQADLDAVLQNWGTTDATWTTGDLNGNGTVEQADLDAVLQRWGLSDIYWLTGDINNSGQVEQGDLDPILQNWGRTDGVFFGNGDINGNGQVEQADLDIILQNWGSAAAPDFRGLAVPEPASLIVILATVLARRPRKKSRRLRD